MKYQDKDDEADKLERENVALKNEMQSIMMRLTKEIEDRKKNEENLAQSLKERDDECFGLTYENF